MYKAPPVVKVHPNDIIEDDDDVFSCKVEITYFPSPLLLGDHDDYASTKHVHLSQKTNFYWDSFQLAAA